MLIRCSAVLSTAGRPSAGIVSEDSLIHSCVVSSIGWVVVHVVWGVVEWSVARIRYCSDG